VTQMRRIGDRLWSWADDLDEATLEQALATSRLPIVHDHVALMADAHLGYGATVGSVIPTRGAIIPSAAGVDLGCGMAAVALDVTAAQLPDDLAALLGAMEQALPAGVGVGHGGRAPGDEELRGLAARRDERVTTWLATHRPRTELDPRLAATAFDQAGSLGSGNHFVEVAVGRDDRVHLVLHSGSRGVGNQLASWHIDRAKGRFADLLRSLELEPDTHPAELAWLVEGTDAFDHYVADMLWAQDYAAFNRELMLDAALTVTARFLGRDLSGLELDRISCHHNYAELEIHDGVAVWVTRKGAIRARSGDRGIIPGSMGTSTFVVHGLGSSASWTSSSHGAGRRLSRRAARRQLDQQRFRDQMAGRTWQERAAEQLLDEAPDAYKDIRQVMRNQADLVEVEDELVAVLNYKGTR
jgi:tRNA-splicing ligase RtcB (3'-phosphate/5'-hydroxy nucleic acid ligase)